MKINRVDIVIHKNGISAFFNHRTIFVRYGEWRANDLIRALSHYDNVCDCKWRVVVNTGI
jgi:hypothetical protein